MNTVDIFDGTDTSPCDESRRWIQFANTEWFSQHRYDQCDEVVTEICDIDTIIFCTGCASNLDMLVDEVLKTPLREDLMKQEAAASSRLEKGKTKSLSSCVQAAVPVLHIQPNTMHLRTMKYDCA